MNTRSDLPFTAACSAGEEDPFAADADPCPPLSPQRHAGNGPAAACLCGGAGEGGGFSRRAALSGMGFLAILPMVPSAAAAVSPPRTLIPCVQTLQKPSPCRHRFCRHYGGSDDYHGR